MTTWTASVKDAGAAGVLGCAVTNGMCLSLLKQIHTKESWVLGCMVVPGQNDGDVEGVPELAAPRTWAMRIVSTL